MAKRENIPISEFVASAGAYIVKEQIAPYGAIRAVVERVTHEDMHNPKTHKTNKNFVIWFRGWKKGVVITARVANRVWLSKLWGVTNTKDMVGKPIWVYVDPTVTFGKERVGGLRFAWGDKYSGSVPPPIPTPADESTDTLVVPAEVGEQQEGEQNANG